jgi:hypothetical protein
MIYSKSIAFASIFLFAIVGLGQSPDNSDLNSDINSDLNSDTSEQSISTPVDYRIIPERGGGETAVPPEKLRPINIPKASDDETITIDGNVDEAIWTTAAKFKDFYQTSPGENISPSKRTEAYMFYDAKNLYIAFRCWDEKDKIRATVAKRDQVFGEDNVRVWLDTYDDRRRAYILGWNPYGIQADGIFTEGRGADFSVDIIMESKGKIFDWGWSVEVKIPFKSLRYSAGEGKNWGFNVARNIDRFNDEFDSWMPDDRNVSGFLIKHGRITGFDEIKTERTLEMIPSVTISETGRRVSDNSIPRGRFVNEPVKKDIGLNLKYTITPNVTLDAAINPDFAEIEADAPVVTANQRFPIFFAEKRPFFLEGADTFQTPLQTFNSRSIVDPDFAAKITGKIGKNSFGIMVASDNAPGNYAENDRVDPNVHPFISEFVDKNALFAILRAKRDFGAENNIGMFASIRSFPERKNYVGGIDGRYKIDPSTVLSFQVVGTHTRKCFFESSFDPADNPVQAVRNGEICGGAIVNGAQVLGDSYSRYRSGNGIGYNINLDHTKDTFGYTLEVSGRTADYFTDAGFTRRRNTHYLFGGVRKSTKSKPKNAIVRANWFNGFNYNFASNGRLIGANWNTNVNLRLQNNAVVNFWGGATRERIYEDEFGLTRNANRDGAFFGEDFREENQAWFGTFYRKSVSKKFSFYGEFNYSVNGYDFDFGAGNRFPRVSPAALAGESRLDPGPGKQMNVGGGVSLAPVDPFRVSFDYKKVRLVRNDTGLTAFDTNVFSLRSTYQFTRFIYTRVRLDYDTLQSSIKGQYLFGWNPSPGTAFFAGYNDDMSYNGFNPYTNALEQGFQRNNRKFFIRVSYLFRKSF